MLWSRGIDSKEPIPLANVAWAHICKCLRSPGINSEEVGLSFRPARLGIDSRLLKRLQIRALVGRYNNSIPTQFLVPIDCLKIPARCWNLWISSLESIPGLHKSFKNTTSVRFKTIFFGSKWWKTNIFVPQLMKEQRKTNNSFLYYQRNEDKPKYLFLNYWRNEDETKYLFLNYRRSEEKPKYLFLNYRRNEDEAKYLFLNYRRNEDEENYLFLNFWRNEDETEYSFLNYLWFDIARTVHRFS